MIIFSWSSTNFSGCVINIYTILVQILPTKATIVFLIGSILRSVVEVIKLFFGRIPDFPIIKKLKKFGLKPETSQNCENNPKQNYTLKLFICF